MKAALRREGALKGAQAALTGAEEPPDSDGLTPRHYEALRLRGLDRQSYEQIARRIGLSVTRTRDIVKEALDRLDAVCRETAEEVRKLELRSLDEMQSVFAPKMRKGNVAAAAVLLKVQLRRDRLLKLSGDDGEDLDPDEVEVVDWVPLQRAPIPAAGDVALNAELEAEAGGGDDGG